MKILALDPGTKCGWATRDRMGRLVHGTWHLSERSGEGGGMRFIRLLRSLDRVRLEHGPIDLVCYEEIRSFMVPMKYGQRRESMSFAAAYAGIKAHIMSWCERYQIPYQGVGPGTVKKFATGSGVASKDQMILAAARSLGTCPVDDNAADALWVLQYAEALDRGDVSMETKTKKKRKREDKSVAS